MSNFVVVVLFIRKKYNICGALPSPSPLVPDVVVEQVKVDASHVEGQEFES